MEWPSFARSQQLALAGGLLAMAGVALPWATIGPITVVGYETDGFLAFMAGGSIVGLVLAFEWRMVTWLGVALFGGLSAVVAGNAVVTLLGTPDAVGPGAYAQVLGGLLAVAGGALATVEVSDEDGASKIDAVEGEP